MSTLSARNLEPILAVVAKLAAPFDLTTMLSEVVSAAKQVLQVSRGTVWLYDAKADLPDPIREVDCTRAFTCLDQCACFVPEPTIDGRDGDPPSAACIASNPHVGEVLLRRVGDELVGVFGGDASFFRADNVRTQIGQVRFQRLDEP